LVFTVLHPYLSLRDNLLHHVIHMTTLSHVCVTQSTNKSTKEKIQ